VTLRERTELEHVAQQARSLFADATADDVLAWAATQFGSGLAVACSMAGDTILPALVSRHRPGVDVLFLDTGYHFAETMSTRDQLAQSVDIHIVDVLPEQTVPQQDARHGPRLHDRDPGLCCELRKVRPLDSRLAGYDAWVTGVRREDNVLRAGTPLVQWDARHQMVKINRIAAWTFHDVLDYARDHLIPVNPLLSQGYPSVGCAPCTRRVDPGDDPRAGRWAGLAKTECGIHL
jgi:phosphoadenosine phosphosulfate reductase